MSLPLCSICKGIVRRVTVDFYKRYGIHKTTDDYPVGHFEETERMVAQIFAHMKGDAHHD